MLRPHLICIAAQECPQHGCWLHDHDQVPVNEGRVPEGMALGAVGNEVCNSTTQDGDVRQRDRLRSCEACTEKRSTAEDGRVQLLQ